MDHILYNAAVKSDKEVFKNIEQPLNSLLTLSENTVLHIYIKSLYQESESMAKFVEELLSMCPSLLWKTNVNNKTPLHLAARYGHIGIAKFLIEQAKNLSQDLESRTEGRMKMLRMMDKEKNMTLHEVVHFDHLEVVKILIHEDPGLSQFANDDSEIPLYMAVVRKFRPVAFTIILSTCELRACGGPLGGTALHAAIMLNDIAKRKNTYPT
ncbi:Alpha-latroinsectotoxin-Lt1a [Morella rubra]|uniref:Alpha-latroinsectotoxin-Lt1a n=1 Tax=Morella rubra TaxID=262757 RepID=A0A6A1W4I4_9ROSI|nr:Alpha-latroinsectotoxin-Lt1a [Morella rubra]